MKSIFLTGSARGGLATLLVAALLPCVLPAVGGSHDPICRTTYEVTGHVNVWQADLGAIEGNRSGVVVWLASAQPGQEPKENPEPARYRMIQIHKTFEPHMLVVPAGSIVEFPNYDPWLHNVFSVSESGRFDLGFYAAGALRAVKFNHVGVSYLFCSIHPETIGIVLTVDSSYFGISDKDGRVSIGNVPSGKYSLHIWYLKAASQPLKAMQQEIVIGANNRSLPRISIVLSKSIQDTVKNHERTEPWISENGTRRPSDRAAML
jgi:plastocyanin